VHHLFLFEDGIDGHACLHKKFHFFQHKLKDSRFRTQTRTDAEFATTLVTRIIYHYPKIIIAIVIAINSDGIFETRQAW
jgi:hypothetical protein